MRLSPCSRTNKSRNESLHSTKYALCLSEYASPFNLTCRAQTLALDLALRSWPKPAAQDRCPDLLVEIMAPLQPSNGDDDCLQEPHPTPGCEWCHGEGYYGVERSRPIPAQCADCNGQNQVRLSMEQEEYRSGYAYEEACCNMDSNCPWCSGARGWVYIDTCGRCAGSGYDPTLTEEDVYIETVRCACFAES